MGIYLENKHTTGFLTRLLLTVSNQKLINFLILQTPLDCEYEPNDIVPIAVGVALAVLVIVVLIAYVIGRRRNRQRGYESV